MYKPAGIFNVTINNIFVNPWTVRLFDALSVCTDINGITAGATTYNPINTREGLNKAIADGSTANECVWTKQGQIIIGNGDAFITGESYPYRSFIEFLKTTDILIEKVKVRTNAQSNITQGFTLGATYPDGKGSVFFFDTSSVISPQQINPLIAEYVVNKTIDKFTYMEVILQPLNFINFDFYFKAL